MTDKTNAELGRTLRALAGNIDSGSLLRETCFAAADALSRQPAGDWQEQLISSMRGHTIPATHVDAWRNFLGLLRDALQYVPALPEGMVAVPREPTVNMALAGAQELPELQNTMGAVVLCKAIYRAMLAAAKEGGGSHDQRTERSAAGVPTDGRSSDERT